jgi:NAD(P)-dependent dehydrogenase (short-subunit alcohol dehydrogenase family)
VIRTTRATLAAVQETGGEAVVIEVDVRDTASVTAFVDAAVTRWGRLDTAVATQAFCAPHRSRR